MVSWMALWCLKKDEEERPAAQEVHKGLILICDFSLSLSLSPSLHPTSSLCEGLNSCLKVGISSGKVMLVVTVIGDKGHLLASSMNGEDISKLQDQSRRKIR